MNIVACISSTKQEVPVGSSLAVPTKGIYQCSRKPDGTVQIDLKQGCIRNPTSSRTLVQFGTIWIEGNVQLTCVYANELYELKATACITPDKSIVSVNTYKVIKEKYYKCVLNQKDATKAEFVEVARG